MYLLRILELRNYATAYGEIYVVRTVARNWLLYILIYMSPIRRIGTGRILSLWDCDV